MQSSSVLAAAFKHLKRRLNSLWMGQKRRSLAGREAVIPSLHTPFRYLGKADLLSPGMVTCDLAFGGSFPGCKERSEEARLQ